MKRRRKGKVFLIDPPQKITVTVLDTSYVHFFDTLVQACEKLDLPYHSLKKRRYPFVYKIEGFSFLFKIN